MTKKSYSIVLLCFFLCCTSCTTIENICIRKEQQRYVGNMMEQYKGKSTEEIMTTFGQPDWTEPNEFGGKDLVYTDLSHLSNSNIEYAVLSYTESATNKAFARFSISNEGMCNAIQTNIGAIYQTIPGEYRCARVYKEGNPNYLWGMIFPPIGIWLLIPYCVGELHGGEIKKYLSPEKCSKHVK